MSAFLFRLTVALMIGPLLAGLAATVLPAFGYFPVIGREAFSLAAFEELFDAPGFSSSLRLTITSGFLATLGALAFAMGFVACAVQRPWMRRFEKAAALLLATPHAALAIGFAFLVLPSGWIARLVSPELTGWLRPPGLVTVRDPWGLSLSAGLLLKEMPYLIVLLVAAMGQIKVREELAAARSLGYSPGKAWLGVIVPRLYGQIRLPLYAVLAFALSVVDVALILAPGTPPPLAVVAARLFSDYDLQAYPRAAAAAVVQLLVVLGALALWRCGEKLVAVLARHWLTRGKRGHVTEFATASAGGGAMLALLTAGFALFGLLVWSFAQSWNFPDAWPTEMGSDTWRMHLQGIVRLGSVTSLLGAIAAGGALVLVLACLEYETRRSRGKSAAKAEFKIFWWLFLPLLVPQISFLFGLQVWLVRLNVDGTLAAVVLAQLPFVLPYIFLSLADAYRALDPRYGRAAAALGASRWRIFTEIKLPLLLKPILVAGAVGFAVSVDLYLPTLFAGAGRISTLTTQAVTLSSGVDRRILGVYGILQAALPAAVYLSALSLPDFLRRRKWG